eukprot:127867_1
MSASTFASLLKALFEKYKSITDRKDAAFVLTIDDIHKIQNDDNEHTQLLEIVRELDKIEPDFVHIVTGVDYDSATVDSESGPVTVQGVAFASVVECTL